jgi:hypothetical protein
MLDEEESIKRLQALVTDQKDLETIQVLETRVAAQMTIESLVQQTEDRDKFEYVYVDCDLPEDQAPKVRHQCVISEENVLKRAWDVYVILLIMYVATVVPLRMSFNMEDTGGWNIWVNFMNCSFAFDIVLTFFSSYYDAEEWEQVYDLRKIARNYLRMWFWIDLFSVLPFEYVIKSFLMSHKTANVNVLARFPRLVKLYQLIKFLRLSKIARLGKSKKSPKNMNEKLKIKEGLERIEFFVFFIVISIHIFTCLWIFIGNLNEEVNWITIKRAAMEANGEEIKGNF